MKTSHKDFEMGCRELSRHVDRIACRELVAHGFDGYDARSDARALNFDTDISELQGDCIAALAKPHLKLFPVWDGASDKIVYSGRAVNYLFRAWHDLTHLDMNLGFDVDSELRVAARQADMLPAGLVREIFEADTMGQTLFAERTGGGFVADQKRFAFDVLNHGIFEAIEMHRGHQYAAE